VSLPLPSRAMRLVESSFDAETVRRARAYAEGGRVHVVKPPPWPVVARVRGTHGYVVTVDLSPSGQALRGDCSCPAGDDCEHAAATALVALARGDAALRDEVAVAEQVRVGEWLADLGMNPGAPRAAPRDDRLIVYLLDHRDGAIGLTVLSCARLRGGGLSSGTPLGAPGDLARGVPPWAELDDVRRIGLLRAVTGSAPAVTRLPLDRIPGDLLRDLAGSGRLYWGSTRSPPLSYGPPRREALGFRPRPDRPGLHELSLQADLVLLAAGDCHYLDLAAGAIGPLDVGVADALVQRLQHAPPVPTAMLATVERSLRPLLSDGAAPLVASDAATAQSDLPAPRPHLIATVDGPDRSVALIGEVFYGDARFALAEWAPASPVPRDLVAEGRLRARLDELSGELPHAHEDGARAVLVRARRVAEVLVPTLRAEGWTCELADDFPFEAPIAELAWHEALRPASDGRGWFELELGVTIAGRTVPLLPVLLQALREGQLRPGLDGWGEIGRAGLNLRLPEGELVHVPAERVQRWLRPLVELELAGLTRGALVVPPLVAAAIADEAPGRYAAGDALAAARQQLAALLDLRPRREGAGFAGDLRPYQRLGLAWLRVLHDGGHGGVLADEMGLGKTVQVLAFLDGLRAERRLAARAPALVVAPRSVVGNWQREAARFAPRLGVAVHLGGERASDAAGLAAAPLVVTSYQTLARDLELFRAVGWTSVIFDEAQAVKNPGTQLRAAAAALRATSRFCITGTPIENHLGELWSQVDLAMPGLFGGRRSFDAVFRRPIEKHGAAAPLEALRRRIRPFLLRRTKLGVALDLPPRTEVVERIELDAAQRDLYESLRLSLDARVRQALKERGVAGSSMVILDALLKLRQCCCDPRLVKLVETDGVGRNGPGGVRGSAKLERLMQMLEELADSGRGTLVFSQFTTMLGLIERACQAAGIATVKLTGATRDREAAIDRFQAGDAAVFLVSLKAGGVGLNLTRADTVIHYDPWWNPAVEAQATDRAHRIGQDRPVTIYKLVARGTLEETILGLQDDKQKLAAAALQAGGVTHLGPEDLGALFRRIG
jgi:superfamily II DNA or RNA helicase